jgi:DNA-binding transcriptional LysR family regulator
MTPHVAAASSSAALLGRRPLAGRWVRLCRACYVGDGHPLLERLTPPIPEIAAEYWIIVHRDLRRSACVRAVIDWVKVVFAEQRDIISGAL